ncbi:hypothetical protein ABT127_05960 [Streptomyces sp. NPDC001904]|uniref:baeRF10 domain-containing protein n=1 Tax=Streptomyces sp. NPDC001904 TaxID=3154531 RepID=UPI00331796B3
MDLAFLTPLCDRPGPWASVYVDAARHRACTAEERTLESLGVQRALAGAGADEATCHAVRMAFDELRHASEPVGRAIFATGGEVVLDPPLRTAPPGTSVRWAALPHTAPLLDLAGADPLCLVARIDRDGVTLALWPDHRHETERHVPLRAADGWEHGAAEVAEAAEAIVRRQDGTGADLVVLIGDEAECAAVRERLPAALRERALRAGPGAGGGRLDVALPRARAAHEAELFAAARSRGEEAAEGVPALVDAAREHRISQLLIRADGPDAQRPVWVGAEPDQVGVERDEPAVLGARDAVPARADDALLRYAAAAGAEAVSVAGTDPAAGPAGGLGALLRWDG